MKEFVDFIIGPSRRMNAIIRFNTRIKTYNEPVSAHTFYVMLYAYIITRHLQKQGNEINMQKVLMKALFHDLEESVAGDILTPFKVKFEKEYEELCRTIIDSVLINMPTYLASDIKYNWKNAKEDYEGEIVDICDDLAGLIYCHEQLKTGNDYFVEIYDDYYSRLMGKIDTIPELKAMLIEIRRRYETRNSK